MSFNKLFNSIKRLHEKENASISEHIIKLQEEVGEIAESHLMTTGYKKMKTSPEEEKKHLSEEAVDAMVVCMAILAANGSDPLEIKKLMKGKIKKWEESLKDKGL